MLQADGKLVQVGSTCVVKGSGKRKSTTYYWVAIRYNPDGTPDTTFGVNGSVLWNGSSTNSGSAVAVGQQSDGTLVVGGNTQINGLNVVDVSRLTTSGAVLGTVTTSVGGGRLNALTIQDNDEIVVGGAGANGIALAKYTPTGCWTRPLVPAES